MSVYLECSYLGSLSSTSGTVEWLIDEYEMKELEEKPLEAKMMITVLIQGRGEQRWREFALKYLFADCE